MSIFPYCCESKTLYVGLDSACNKPSLICTLHTTHPNPSGIMHNIMPITHFKTVVNQLKFQMSDKVATLVDRYNNFMDELIAQITELKCRKSIQISTLWMRQLAKTEEQYEHFKKIFRNDLQGFSCKQIYNFYEKMLRGVNIRQRKLEDIDCYKEIDRVLEKLATSAKARMMIIQKVADLEGIVQSGELLKKALPDRTVLKENTREILLQNHSQNQIQVRYNRAILKKGSNNYRSIFSKYPLLSNTNYHLSIKTKYGNVLIGVSQQKLKNIGNSLDLHYNVHSLTYNCSNGCTYRDAMFESGNAHLTKSKKELQLILRTNDTEMLILLDKNVVCRTQLKQFAKKSLYLHILMRTEGDSFQIDSDKLATLYQRQQQIVKNDSIVQQVEVNTVNLDIGSLPSELTIDKLISQKKVDERPSTKEIILNKNKTIVQSKSGGTIDLKKIDSDNFSKDIRKNRTEQQDSLYFRFPPKKETTYEISDSIKLGSVPKNLNDERSKVLIQFDNSLYASKNAQDEQKLQKRNTKPEYTSIKLQSNDRNLLNPIIMTPIRISQFEDDFKDDYQLEKLPSLNFIPKQISGLTYVPQGIRSSSEIEFSEQG